MAVALGLGAWGMDACALGFGEPEVASALGQPLRLRVPLQVESNDELSPQCLRLLGNPRDPVPALTQAQALLSIEEKGPLRWLHIDSRAAIDEPILRVTVEAGCTQHVQREFVLLLDPPSAPARPALSPALMSSLSPQGNVNVAAPDSSIASEVGATPELDLGVARVQGKYGQSLSMQIPVLGSAAATLDNGSIRLVRLVTGDGAPLATRTSASLSRTDEGTVLQVLTGDPVSEPAVRVQVEVASANARVRREYGVLLDLPAPLAKAADSANPPFGVSEAATPPPAPQAGSAASATPALQAEAESPAAPTLAPPPAKPRKHAASHLSRLDTPSLALAPANAPDNGAAKGDAPKAEAKASAEAKADEKAPTLSSPKGPDRLVLSAPQDQVDAAAKRFAEMDQRVKDLTQEIVKLRGDLAAQKAREAELVAQAGRPSGNWILAMAGALGLGIAVFLLWARRRAGAGGWNPASWDAGSRHGAGKDEDFAPDTRLAEALLGDAISAEAEGTARASGTAGGKGARRAAGTAADPVTIHPHTTPIEVTEVLGNEPSIEQLYTLFYDVGSNTDPNARKGAGKGPQPSSMLPPLATPKHDTLDLDLGGIPDSVQSAKAARAQGAMMLTPGTSAVLGGSTQPRTGTEGGVKFTYEDRSGEAVSGSARAGELNLDEPTNVGPATELPRDAAFPATQPTLDLDLTTNIGPLTQVGPATEIPTDDTFVRPTVPVGKGLDLDLSTNLHPLTEVGPPTEMPRDLEESKTEVSVDLDLNTNVAVTSSRDSDQR